VCSKAGGLGAHGADAAVRRSPQNVTNLGSILNRVFGFLLGQRRLFGMDLAFKNLSPSRWHHGFFIAVIWFFLVYNALQQIFKHCAGCTGGLVQMAV
jgi:hypothetical protein